MDHHTKWFTNRGQVLQTVLAGMAVIAGGINAWPHLKNNQGLSAGAILFYLLIAITLLSVWLLVRGVTSQRLEPSTPIRQAPPPNRLEIPPAPLSTQAFNVIAPVLTASALQAEPKRIIEVDRDAFMTTIHLNVGDYQDFSWKPYKVRIEILEISKVRGQFGRETDGASIQMSIGGALVWGGQDCEKVGVNTYRVPRKESSDEESCSIYFFHISENYFRFSRIFIDHINPQRSLVTLNAFFFDWSK